METGEVGRTPEQFFQGSGDGLSVFHAVEQAVHDFSDSSIKVTKSQIAFRRRKGFAYLWRPDQYLRSDVPVVLSIVLPYKVVSPRIKQVAHPSRDVWMHHLELHRPDEIDREVQSWLAEAFENAR